MPAAPAPTPTPVPRLAKLKAEVIALREQLERIDPAEFADVAALAGFLKTQLVMTIVPLFESLIDGVVDDVVAEVNDLGAIVDGLADQEEEFLSEATSKAIEGVFDAGELVCRIAAPVAKLADNVTGRKLVAAVAAFRALAIQMRPVVQELAEPDEDPDGGGDGEAAGDDAGDGEPDEGGDAGDGDDAAGGDAGQDG